MKTENTVILVFAKAPVEGECKTRLIPALGRSGATMLHAAMVQHTLAMVIRAALGPVQLWCSPLPQHPFFGTCRDQHRLTLHRQRGHDLGSRMAHAIKQALKRSARVILIGTDCPALNEKDLHQAHQQLSAGNDVVIGPANDGGYVLIALNQTSPQLFQSIDWGSAKVLQQTRKRLRQLGYHWHELEMRRDIDTTDDLASLTNTSGDIVLGSTRIPVTHGG
jgi:rSAM/selenodomain-associated transferase 1